MKWPASLCCLALLLTGSALADEYDDNLRQLSTADLCPPVSYAYVDDEEDEELASALDAQLEKYSALFGIAYGDPKTCTVVQSLHLDTFQGHDQSYVYLVQFNVEMRDRTPITLPPVPGGTKSRTVPMTYLTLWQHQGYGSIAYAEDIEGTALDEVRNHYEAFALAWKATHKSK